MGIKLTIVVAMSRNRAIGLNNALPWRLPEDLKRFKRVTMGHPMIMGRLTYESIGRPLPGRKTIVVTRDDSWRSDGVDVAHSIQHALQRAESAAEALGVTEIMIVGGANIYAQTIDMCTRMLVTEVHTEIQGDAYFPSIDTTVWRETLVHSGRSDGKESLAYTFKELVKR